METMDKKEFAGKLLDNYGDDIFEETPKMEELNPFEKWLILKLFKALNPSVAIESSEPKTEQLSLPPASVDEGDVRKYDKDNRYNDAERLLLAQKFVANKKSNAMSIANFAEKYGVRQPYLYQNLAYQTRKGHFKKSSDKKKAGIELIAEEQSNNGVEKKSGKRGTPHKISTKLKAARLFRDRAKNGLSNLTISKMTGIHGSYIPKNYDNMVRQGRLSKK